jgi:hypothetical protein
MKNGAMSPDPHWRRVSRGLTAALMLSVWLVEARGDAISELTAYYNKVDADLGSAIERGEVEKARNLLKLRNNIAKELTRQKTLASGASNSTPTPTPALKTPPVETIIVAKPSPQVTEKSDRERAPRGKRRDRYVGDKEKEDSEARAKVSATPKPTPSATPNGTDTDTSLERWMGPNFNNP